MDFRNKIHEMNECFFDQKDSRVRLGPFGAFILIEQYVGEAIDPVKPYTVDVRTNTIAGMEKPPIVNFFVNNVDDLHSPMVTIQEEEDKSARLSQRSKTNGYSSDEDIQVHEILEDDY